MKRLLLLVAAVTVVAVPSASANYNDPLRIGLSNSDDCGGGFCPSGGTSLTAGSAPFPESGLMVHNTNSGFGLTGEADDGTGVRALGHSGDAATWSENDSTGAGLYASGWWGDGIFAVSNSGINKSGVYGESKSGQGYGVVGRTNAGSKPALWGDNVGGGEGVEGTTKGNWAAAVVGRHQGSNPGFGVWGETANGQGVVGKSTYGNGTEGVSNGSNVSGVWAHHEGSSSGFGLYAHTNVGTGVHGDGSAAGVEGTASTAGGVGVLAQHTGGGTALKVSGKASFSRSGVVSLASNAGSKVVSVAVTSASYALATLQTNAPGLFVRAVVPNPGSNPITIYFNTTAPAGTRIAWFVVN